MRVNWLFNLRFNVGFKLRFGLRAKLLLLSCVLLTVPWFGYQYVWEMEKYLRFGQEQTLIGTARALATSLHERPKLFENQASFLPSVEKGKDLYGYELYEAIKLDGHFQDWPHKDERSHHYGFDHQIIASNNDLELGTIEGKTTKLKNTKISKDEIVDNKPVDRNLRRESTVGIEKQTLQQFNLSPQLPELKQSEQEVSLRYTASIGKFDKYLYLRFSVTDDHVIYRAPDAISIFNNDHIELALIDADNQFIRYVISNKKPGWIDGFRINNLDTKFPAVAPELQGQWLETPQGYNVEIRLPLHKLGDKLAFVVHDVDEDKGAIVASIGSADTRSSETLGTVLVPSPEIERIVKGMSYTNSSVWVVDQHRRVLASAGNLKDATGVWKTQIANDDISWWRSIEKKWLHPLYYKILTKPSKNFVDQLYDRSNLTGKHIESALLGKTQSQWRLTQDQKAVILSAAYPIFIDNKVKGAVIVEETTNGIRTVRNRALEKLFSAILAILVIGSLVFFIFASRISGRILTLRKQTETAIDKHGRITGAITPSRTNDEIGDLSRSFSSVVNRLSEYNHYLENMSSRLSHELRTPIAVVRTSLENLSMLEVSDKSQPYLDRAQSGITRLNDILTRMSEATRLEHSLKYAEQHSFDLGRVLSSCIKGFEQIHPKTTFEFEPVLQSAEISGSADHIAQMLDKVISNAVEFSADDIVRISFKCDKQYYELSIENKGDCLPSQMQEQLFDSMVSVRKEENSSTPHLGLGLYIARLIVEFHNGKISARNTPDEDGVTIKMLFPVL